MIRLMTQARGEVDGINTQKKVQKTHMQLFCFDFM